MKTETENAVILARKLATEDKTPEQIALALYAKDGLDLDMCEVARILFAEEGLDLSAAAVSRRMGGMGIPLNLIARVLYSPEGLNLTVESTVLALYKGLNHCFDGHGGNSGKVRLQADCNMPNDRETPPLSVVFTI